MEKNKRPGQDTMTSVITDATRQMIAETGQSVSAFATTALVPALEIQELINLGSDGLSVDDYTRWRSRSIKRVQRIMEAETPLPADWILTWVAVLPEPYSSKCRHKIAAMQGLLWVPLPTHSPTRTNSVVAEIDVITVKFGSILANAEPAHDGFYDDNDDQKSLKRLQNRLLELYSHIKREMFNIESATGVSPDNVEIGRLSVLSGVNDAAA